MAHRLDTPRGPVEQCTNDGCLCSPPPPPARTCQCWSRQTPAWTRSVHLDAPGQRHRQQPDPRTADPGVVKSSGGSVDTTKTSSDPQRVRLSSGERPIGAAKGKQSDTEALCHPPPPLETKGPFRRGVQCTPALLDSDPHDAVKGGGGATGITKMVRCSLRKWARRRRWWCVFWGGGGGATQRATRNIGPMVATTILFLGGPHTSVAARWVRCGAHCRPPPPHPQNNNPGPHAGGSAAPLMRDASGGPQPPHVTFLHRSTLRTSL